MGNRLVRCGILLEDSTPSDLVLRIATMFGTLEEGQARVGELAQAGVTEVRCWVPGTPDLADVIAQLSAVPVGTLRPSQEGHRAQPPPAPAGWGGRPRRVN